MNVLHARVHTGQHHSHSAAPTRRDFDWSGQIKLALVLSVIAAVVASTLARRIGEPALIVGIIVVASFVAWARVEPVARSARVPVRRR